MNRLLILLLLWPTLLAAQNLVSDRDAASSIAEDAVFYVVADDGSDDWKAPLSLVRTEIIGTGGSEIATALFAESDTNNYDDDAVSKLASIEDSADVTDTANVTSAGALMDSEVTNLSEVKAFDSTDYATAAQGALADSAVQPSDNISDLTNDSGFTDDTAADAAQATADAAIPKATFDANTILAADSDDTPAALTVAEQTLVGRITSGNIDALTASEVRTLLNVEDGADVTDTANVTSAGALMDSEVTNLSDVKAFDPADYATAAQGSTADSALQDITSENLTDLADVDTDKSKTPADGDVLTFDGTDWNAEAASGGGGAFSADGNGLISASSAPVLDEATGDEAAYTFNYTTNKATSGADTGLLINQTDTASPGTSLLADFQVGGSSAFSIDNSGSITVGLASDSNPVIRRGADTDQKLEMRGNIFRFYDASDDHLAQIALSGGIGVLVVPDDGEYRWSSTSSVGASADLQLARDAAGTLAQRNSTNAQTFRIYGTYTDATNYERLALTGGAITVQTAGTGDDDIDLTLTPAGLGGVNVANFTKFTSSYTVSSLPAGAVGMLARVTDADSPSIGSTVSGGGSSAALCWYNGSNWTVIGI